MKVLLFLPRALSTRIRRARDGAACGWMSVETQGSVAVSLGGLAAGVYMIRLNTDAGVRMVRVVKD